MTGREHLPFPKPIRDAIELLQDTTIERWLKWRLYTHDSTRLALVLVTLGEYRDRTRVLWGTWEKYSAAAMQESLRRIGITVANGAAFDLPPHSDAMLLWYLPPTNLQLHPPQTLLQVFNGDHHARQ